MILKKDLVNGKTVYVEIDEDEARELYKKNEKLFFGDDDEKEEFYDKMDVVTVEVDVIAIGTSRTRHRAVATIIGTIRVIAGENINVHVIQEVDDAAFGAGAQLVDQAKHEDHACHLVAVHRRAVEELRLAVRIAFVNAHAIEVAVVRGGKLT